MIIRMCTNNMGKFQNNTTYRKIFIYIFVLSIGAGYISSVFAESATDIQKQIEAQRVENEQLKEKIATIEKVLKTDVCSNPEAAKLLESDDGHPAANAPDVK
jgi:hypothetical protein